MAMLVVSELFVSHKMFIFSYNLVFCSDGCEIQKEHGKNKTGYINSPETIYRAATQAAIASLGFLHERMPRTGVLPLLLPSNPLIMTLPIVVTTAELAICVTPPSNVDLSTGLLPDLQLTNVDWLAYRFPFHPGAATGEADFRVTSPTQNYVMACTSNGEGDVDQYKETIYIVKSDRLAGFVLQMIPKLIEGMILPP